MQEMGQGQPGRRLRVIQVLCDLHSGGAERLVLDLCRRAPPDIQVELVTVFDGGARAGDSSVTLRSAGRRRRRLDRAGLARLKGLLEGADLVHAHQWAGELWTQLALRGAAVGRLRTEHDTRPEPLWRRAALAALRPRWAAEVAVSGAVAERLRREGRTALLIPNGVELGPWLALPPPPEGPLRVAFVGRLTRQKGLETLIDALLPLQDLHLDVLGEGELEAALRRRAAPLGGRARFWGFVPRPAELLGRAHMVALPSRWEAFGLVAVEAMAAGRALLASRVDGLPEVVGEAGLLLPPDDAPAWRQALAGLAADPQRRAALGQQARARSLHFDIARTAEAHWALYRRLCAPRPP